MREQVSIHLSPIDRMRTESGCPTNGKTQAAILQYILTWILETTNINTSERQIGAEFGTGDRIHPEKATGYGFSALNYHPP